MKTQNIGKLGEDAACRYLKKNKYKILERNYRQKFGEIDIIVTRKDTVTFVEVKTRKDDNFGLPCEYVTYSKKKRIIKTAYEYILENSLDTNYSFDVIEVYHQDGKVTQIRHIKNAFEVEW